MHQITLPWIPRHHFGVEGCTTSSYWVLTCLNKQQECTSLIVSLPMIILMCFVNFLSRNSNKSTCKWLSILAMYLYAYTYVYTHMYIYIYTYLYTVFIINKQYFSSTFASSAVKLSNVFEGTVLFTLAFLTLAREPRISANSILCLHALPQSGWPSKAQTGQIIKGHRKTKWGTNKSSTRD